LLTVGRQRHALALAAILLAALGLRLYNLGFGLPSLYDPDEPLFVIKGVELLTDGTMNPRWFGHPGTTTIYLSSLTTIIVLAWGMVVGWWGNITEFTRAAYTDPGLLFLPLRFVMVLIGVATVWLTYLVGRQLNGQRTGLIAAAFLATNGLHVIWSQVVRTDICASLFILAALFFSARIVADGRLRDFVLAGVMTGLGVATKWPAATVFVAIIGAAVARIAADRGGWRGAFGGLALSGLAAAATLVVISPYLILDFGTVMADLGGEARPVHLGHTGLGFFGNLAAYIEYQVAGSMGWVAIPLIVAGAVVSTVRSRAARWTLLPATISFLALISAQQLIWSRWILPALPFLAIYCAVAVEWLASRLPSQHSERRAWAATALACLCLLPTLTNLAGAIGERRNDTRAMAARWAVAHIPAGNTIVLEHLELSLRTQPWKILFPVGQAGCIDGVGALRSGVRYDDVNRHRKGSPIVDLGNVAPDRLDSCRADFAILTYYDLYKREAAQFPEQNRTYHKLLERGRTVALFTPEPSRAGGPIVRIIELPNRAPSNSGQDKNPLAQRPSGN